MIDENTPPKNEYKYHYKNQSGHVMANTLIEARGNARVVINLDPYLMDDIVVRLTKVDGVPYSILQRAS